MNNIPCHLDPEDLERYSMGTCPREATDRIEEHLLICEGCQNRLQETDAYLSAMRTASEQFRREERSAERHTSRIPTWLPVMATVACGIVLVIATPRFTQPPGPAVAVSLTALRSDGTGDSAPSGRELVLHPDLTGLAEAPSYRLEIVTSTGQPVRQGKLTRSQNGIQVRALGAGLYFVRVYLPAGELLREYGLRIR